MKIRLRIITLSTLFFASFFMATAQEPQYGGTLIVASDRTPANLHPGRSTSLPDIAISMVLYDGLIITGPDGVIYPGLAESWEGSEDGLSWTFNLRQDVVFHSGNPLTAHDVKAHFDLWQADYPTRAKLATLERTEVIDDHTVVFHLNTPTLVFLSMISQTEWGYGGIPEAAAVEEWGEDYGVVPESISGTGPFKLVEWRRDQEAVLEANEDYNWGAGFYDNTGRPYVDRLVFRSIPEASSRSAALELGEIHMDISVSPLNALTLEFDPNLQILTQSRIAANHIGFNMRRELFDDARVRRAFTHALNQSDVVEGIWLGFADETVGFWHPSLDGATPASEIRPLVAEFDLNQAAALLDEAGFVAGSDGIRARDGLRLAPTIWVYTAPHEQIAVILQANLRQIGVDLNIRTVEYAAWDDAIRDGQHDMYVVDGSHSTADFMYWFTEAAIPSPNRSFWTDADTERFYEISQTTTDPAERTAAFQDFEKQLITEAIVIPLPHHSWIVGTRNDVHGVQFHPIHGLFKYMDVWVE